MNYLIVLLIAFLPAMDEVSVDGPLVSSNVELPFDIYDATSTNLLMRETQKIIDATQVVVPVGLKAVSLYNVVEETLENNLELEIARLKTAKRGDKSIAEQELKRTTLDKIAQAHEVYWELVYARVNLAIRQQALVLAADLLRENRIRYKYGDLISVEVYETEARVRLQEVKLIEAERELEDRMDNLRQLVVANQKVPDWQIPLIPTDPPIFFPIEVDEEVSQEVALGESPEVKVEKFQVRSTTEKVLNVKQQVIYSHRKAVRKIYSLQREIESAISSVRAETSRLESGRIGYEQGVVNSYDLLLIQNQYTKSQKRKVRAVVDYYLALVELERVRGTLLYSLGFEFILLSSE